MIKSAKIYHFLTQIAGIDEETLNTCSNYEKIKQTGIGMLIMIPFLLGFISMSFAIATLTDKWYFYIPIGLVWGIIILIIDRFLVSTFKKSESIKKDLWSLKLLVRLCFSIGIGITVSHPLVLFLFDKEIKDELSSSFTKKQREIYNNFISLSKKLNEENQNFDDNNIKKINSEIECLLFCRLAESNSKTPITVTCKNNTTYTTSGQPYEGSRVATFDSIITIKKMEQESLLKEKNIIVVNNNYILEMAKKQAKKDSIALEKNYSTGYLSRTRTLSKLINDPNNGNTVMIMELFLLIFFIFLDVLPVILKALLEIGEYDKKIQRIESQNIYFSNYDFDIQKEIETIKKENRYIYQKSKLLRMVSSDFDSEKELNDYMNAL